MSPQTICELDIVALLRDLPEEGLSAGQTGTAVLVHNGGEAFEVEFPLEGRGVGQDRDRRKYAVVTVRGAD